MDLSKIELRASIPQLVGQPRVHAHVDNGYYGTYDMLGLKLAELSEIELPTVQVPNHEHFRRQEAP